MTQAPMNSDFWLKQRKNRRSTLMRYDGFAILLRAYLCLKKQNFTNIKKITFRYQRCIYNSDVHKYIDICYHLKTLYAP